MNLQQGIIKDLSVKLLLKYCELVSIVTSLLYANYKENLTTKISANKQNRFLKASLHLFMFPWQQHIRQLDYQKTKVCVNLLATIFGDQRIKGFREKGKRNIGIKNCVQPP